MTIFWLDFTLGFTIIQTVLFLPYDLQVFKEPDRKDILHRQIYISGGILNEGKRKHKSKTLGIRYLCMQWENLFFSFTWANNSKYVDNLGLGALDHDKEECQSQSIQMS